MNSPSSSVWMRMMPCMAGWAGPTPIWRFCWPPEPVPAPSPSMKSRRTGSGLTLLLRPDQRLAAVDRVVLAKGVSHELLVHQQAARVGMAAEADAEHVPHLALEPVGDGPQVHGRRHRRVVLVH